MAEVGLRTLLAFLLLWPGPLGRVWATRVCAPDCDTTAVAACEPTCTDHDGDSEPSRPPRGHALQACYCCEVGLPCTECFCCVARDLTPRTTAEARGLVAASAVAHSFLLTSREPFAAVISYRTWMVDAPRGRAASPPVPLRI